MQVCRLKWNVTTTFTYLTRNATHDKDDCYRTSVKRDFLDARGKGGSITDFKKNLCGCSRGVNLSAESKNIFILRFIQLLTQVKTDGCGSVLSTGLVRIVTLQYNTFSDSVLAKEIIRKLKIGIPF